MYGQHRIELIDTYSLKTNIGEVFDQTVKDYMIGVFWNELESGLDLKGGQRFLSEMEEGEFSKVVLKNKYELDYNLAKQDILNASNELVKNNKQIGAIVLECTNMVPFAADIRKSIGLPVFSIYNFILWFQNSLIPKRFNINLDDPR